MVSSTSGPPAANPAVGSPVRPDHLAGAVLRSLSRPVKVRMPNWPAVRTLLLGVLSLGIWPLLSWPRRFRDLVNGEQQQLWHLAEWLRLRTGHEQATELQQMAQRLRFRPLLWVIAMLLAAGVAAAFVVALARPHLTGPEAFSDLMASTYRFGRLRSMYLTRTEAGWLFAIWNLGLCTAYLLHWLQVALHQTAVRRFIEQFNRVAALEQLPPVDLPRIELGLRPLWLLGAAALLSTGAVWGLPMMLSGASQKRYIAGTNGLRPQLAQRVRALLLRQHHTAGDVALSVQPRMHCAQEVCRSPLPPGSRFCPRCGTPTAGPLEVVA